MSCLPQAYTDKIEFLNLETMDEVIRHAKLCFTQFKQRTKYAKSWQHKYKDKFDPKKKNFKHRIMHQLRNTDLLDNKVY